LFAVAWLVALKQGEDKDLESLKKNHSIISYGLLVMTATHTLTHVFTRVHTTLFPILKDEFSLSLQQLGIIAAIPPLCQAILCIPTGLLSDKIGSKKMILISLAASTLGAIFAARALNPTMLIVAVSLLYLNTTIYHPAAYSFVTRLFRPNDRLRALGIHGAGGTLGVAVGPISISIIMGLLALGWRTVYFFWLFPLLLGIMATLRITSEPQEDVPDDSSSAENPTPATSLLSASLIMFLVFVGVRMVATSMSQSFIALYLVDSRGLSESLSSFLIGSTTLVGIVAAPLGGFLAVRFGEKRWLLIVLTLAYACFGLAFLVPTNGGFIALYLAYGFLNVLGMAANSAIMAKLTPGKQRGLGYALFFLPGSIMGAVAPVIAASIAEAFTLSSIFYASTAVFFLSLGVLKFGVRVQSS
jgi:FSR family fosmidomycin resistance protein-like MFS transporter